MGNQALRRPPQGDDLRERILPDGAIVHWCREYVKLTDHFQVNHTPTHDAANVADGRAGNVRIGIFGISDNNVVVPEVVEELEDNAVAAVFDDGDMVRLRASRLI